MREKWTTGKFIEEAKKVHGDRYDYSKVVYINQRTKVHIICSEHGEFEQTPSDHLQGHGCPKCGGTKALTQEEFIRRAREVHGDRYDYSKVVYINQNTKVCIICPEHGEFEQTPLSHIYQRSGCPKCKGRVLTTGEVVQLFREKHGDRYDYSKVEYKKMHEKVCIICPEHGEFEQTPSKHLSGQGCPLCGIESRIEKRIMSKESFIEKANKIHNNKYDYSNVSFTNTHQVISIICPQHGNFEQMAYIHLQGHGCPKCGNIISYSESEIYNRIKKEVREQKVFHNKRGILKDNREIDIYLPEYKLGIEYDGLYWHSEYMGKGRNYHLNKTMECKENDIRLIHIFEDEYIYKKDLVINKILYILGKCENLPKIDGRKCEIKEVGQILAKTFLEKYNIKGYTKGSVYIGAFYEGRPVGIMSFIKRKGDNGKWELNRMATCYEYKCRGICGKMFKYFIDKYNPNEIKTFADRRWLIDEDNNIYSKLGFIKEGYTKPDYTYVCAIDPIKRLHKFYFRKKELFREYHLPIYITEKDMIKRMKYTKMWDCGCVKYIWKKKL